jgi:hypothetical protein
MGILAIALFAVPGQGWRTEALYAGKIGKVPLPTVALGAVREMPQADAPELQEALPRKRTSPQRASAPTLRIEDTAAVNKLSRRSTLSGAL